MEDQTGKETVTATETDEFGATATQIVTLTITGTNDSPVITSNPAAASDAVIEPGNMRNGTVVAGTPSANGTLTSSDVDSGATATWSGNASGTYGAFAINPTTGAWTYTLDNSDVDTQARSEERRVGKECSSRVTADVCETAKQRVTLTSTGTK